MEEETGEHLPCKAHIQRNNDSHHRISCKIRCESRVVRNLNRQISCKLSSTEAYRKSLETPYKPARIKPATSGGFVRHVEAWCRSVSEGPIIMEEDPPPGVNEWERAHRHHAGAVQNVSSQACVEHWSEKILRYETLSSKRSRSIQRQE